MQHTFWSWLLKCVNIKWIRLVLWKIQSGHDSVHRRTDGQAETSIPPSTSLSREYDKAGTCRVYRYPIFKWDAVTWLNDIHLMAARETYSARRGIPSNSILPMGYAQLYYIFYICTNLCWTFVSSVLKYVQSITFQTDINNDIYHSFDRAKRCHLLSWVSILPNEVVCYHRLAPHKFLCSQKFDNISWPRKDGRHLADNIFKCICVDKTALISIKIELKPVPKGPIDNKLSLVQVMAGRRTGDKP